MKKWWALLLAVFILPRVTMAQTSFDSGEGCLNVVELSYGTASGGYGATGQAVRYLHERFVNEQFSLGVGVGYTYLDTYRISALPVFFSAHYFFLDRRFSPFVGLRLGGFFLLDAKNVDTFQKYSISSRAPGFNLYVSPSAGLKMHLSSHVGIMATIGDDAFLVKTFDNQDYRAKLAHSLSASVGICFQIPGW